MIPYMTFRADRLREAREAVKENTKGKKGSQNWLAHRVGAHVTSISDWERGRNEPSARYVAKLADALGVSTDRLLEDEDEEAASMPTHHDLLEALRPLAELFSRERVA